MSRVIVVIANGLVEDVVADSKTVVHIIDRNAIRFLSSRTKKKIDRGNFSEAVKSGLAEVFVIDEPMKEQVNFYLDKPISYKRW